jgi:hypothetical protein
MNYSIPFLFLFISLAGCGLTGPGNEAIHLSPDGKIELRFAIDKGVARYAVNYNRTPLLLPSGLGFDIQGQNPWATIFL